MEAFSLRKSKPWSQSWGADVSESLYLLPGALYVGNEVKEVKTLLGSCVAVTLWHPEDKVCAMTHIVLPSSKTDSHNPKFATGAIHHLSNVLNRYAYQPKDFVTRVYGGGQMFGHDEEPNKVIDIGNTNVRKTLTLLKEAGFRTRDKDTQGRIYRHVVLDRESGAVTVKRTRISATMG
ncbi:MAG: chemotaxis protein CheD [Sedimentisphaerales bacterium]|jgi:chemotaxis protein CheD